MFIIIVNWLTFECTFLMFILRTLMQAALLKLGKNNKNVRERVVINLRLATEHRRKFEATQDPYKETIGRNRCCCAVGITTKTTTTDEIGYTI